MKIEVRAHARLHFGFLDLSGERGRRFGGVGLPLSWPRYVLHVTPAEGLVVEGEDRGRVSKLAELYHEVAGCRPRARIRVSESIPGHIGLGSGTQAALAVATALARLYGDDRTSEELCRMMGRGGRSGVGYHTFRQGGVVVEGGHPSGAQPPRTGPAPLLMRREFPEDWRIVLVIPASSPRVSGEIEEAAFARLPPVDGQSVDRMAGIVLLRLLPALAEHDLDQFGAAVAEMQDRVGAWFAAAQGGPFHQDGAPIVRALREGLSRGVGQSSWGPTVYAFAADELEEKRVISLAQSVDRSATVTSVRGWNRGAEIRAL
jgi:beta-RFAP synthase